jgi:hypothetical protein
MRVYLFLLIVIIKFNVWSNDSYYNSFFKFKIIKPDNWIQVDESERLRNQNIFDFTEEQKEEITSGHKGNVFLVTFLKYDPSTKSGIIPTVNVTVMKNKSATTADLIQLAENTNEDFKKCFEKYEIIEKPSIVKINNIESVMVTSRFILIEDHEKYIIKSKMFLIPKANYLFQVNFVNEFNNSDGEKEFMKIQNQIFIDN